MSSDETNGDAVVVEHGDAHDAAATAGSKHQPGSDASNAGRGGGIASSYQAHAAPLKHVTGGTATNAEVDQAADGLIDSRAKGATDDPDLKDLGWAKPHHDVTPLFRGLDNEDLWTLVRRFNKQVFHLRAVAEVPLGGLDLVAGDDQEFSADKLRAEFERLYVSCLTSSACFVKHLARLRSWNERRRTTAFAAAYAVAWWFDLVVPALLLMLIIMVAFKPSRAFLFPPAPLALVNSSTGTLQKPKAGMLGSSDSLTGAPEAHRGEAVEHEASHFFTGVASVTVATAMGAGGPDKGADGSDDSGGDDDDDDGSEGGEAVKGAPAGVDKKLPDPTAAVAGLADARGVADSSKPDAADDATKAPVQASVWDKAVPLLRGLAATSDMQEILANALSPVPPFSHAAQYRLAGLLVPAVLGTALADAHLVTKGVFAGIGLAFFTQPLQDRAIAWISENIHDWDKILAALDPRSTVLKGVPTNAQLTLALMRIAEAAKAPIPPPPRASKKPPAAPSEQEVADAAVDSPLGTEADVSQAVTPSIDEARQEEDAKVKSSSALVAIIKGGLGAAINTGLGKAHVEASTFRSRGAQNRLGALPRNKDRRMDGPSNFRARFHGKKGHAWLTTTAVTASVAFSKGSPKPEEDTKPVWSIQIDDIRELKKVDGFGWKSKLIVGAVLKRDTADGIEITDAEGHVYRLTAVYRRDELFDRLASLGSHKWVRI